MGTTNTEIGYYFGIGPIKEIVRKRRDKFVNGYVASDNCLCRLLFRINVNVFF